MATVLEALKGVNAYPIPLRTLSEVAEGRGISLTEESTKDVLESRGFNLAKADLLLWLSLAPNITQGGQSYSFSDEQRVQLRNRANALYAEYDEDKPENKTIFGYKGSRL